MTHLITSPEEGEYPTNDTLQRIGAFGRSCKIGKHQATNWVHLRATVDALDAAGHREAADTLIWQVWHRVNSEARHNEFYRIGLDEKDAAEARAATAEAEVAELKHRYEHCDENFDALMQIVNWAVQHDEFEIKHEGGPDAAALNITDLADSFKDRALAAEATASSLRDRVAVLEEALQKIDKYSSSACDTYSRDTLPGELTVLKCWQIIRRCARTALQGASDAQP